MTTKSASSLPKLSRAPIVALTRLGKPGRVAASELEVVKRLGVRGTRQRRREAAVAAQWTPIARRSLYDKLWERAANELDAKASPLAGDFTVIERDDRLTVVYFHIVQLNDPVTNLLALDKKLVHDLLVQANVPVPAHVEATPQQRSAAHEFMAESTNALVVKPADGTSGGSGVTCGVKSAADLHSALIAASRGSGRVLVERQAWGDEYRFLFLDGELLDVIRRRAPRVTGDGRSSVARLISEENRRRARARGQLGISHLEINLDTLITLERNALSLSSVVPAGVSVEVKSTANQNGACDNETVDLRLIAPSLVAEVARAAEVLGLRFAGVDIITPDLKRSLSESGGVVLEVNGTPGLHYHYLVADSEVATEVALPVLRALLDSGNALTLGRSATRTPDSAPVDSSVGS
jgi:cyanophycin synthetase